MYKIIFVKLPSYRGKKIIQSHFMDTDSFVLSINTKDIIEDSQNPGDLFDLSTFNKNHEIFTIKKRSDW